MILYDAGHVTETRSDRIGDVVPLHGHRGDDQDRHRGHHERVLGPCRTAVASHVEAVCTDSSAGSSGSDSVGPSLRERHQGWIRSRQVTQLAHTAMNP